MVTSWDGLQKRFGVARRMLQKWRDKGCPISKVDGVYDCDAIQQWINESLPRSPRNELTQGTPGTEDGDEEPLSVQKLREEVRKLRAQADQEEDKRDKIRGNLITLAEARRELVSMATKVKQNVLALPRSNADRLCNLDTPAQVELILTEILTEALEALHTSGSGKLSIAKSLEEGDSTTGETISE